MMRSAAIFAFLGLILGACSDGDEATEGPTGAELEEAPYGPGVEIDRTYDYALYVHCGVEWARIDGTWWQTAPLNDGNANPPKGWGNPYHDGELVLIDDTSAMFAGPDGPIEFARTDRSDSPNADCE
jgi:hypothetical protein